MIKLFRRYILSISVGFFFLLIFVPNIGVFREQANIEDVREMENRSINKFPTAILFSPDFFKQLQGWYEDRILGRNKLINKWAILNGKLFDVLTTPYVVRGKDGYLFCPANMTHDIIEAEPKLDTLSKISNQCKTRNIRFVFSLAPNSEMVLSDLYPDKYKPFSLGEAEDNVARELDRREIEYCFIGKEISSLPLEERKQMYTKGDYHWSLAGAYVSGKALLKYLHYDSIINKPIRRINSTVSSGGCYDRDTGLTPSKSYVYKPWNDSFVEKFYVTDSRDIDLSKGKMIAGMGEYGQDGENIIINRAVDNKRTVLLLGDSFSGGMAKYFLQDVHKVIFTHCRDISEPKTKIDIEYLLDRYKPDVVIYLKMEAFFFRESYIEMFGNTYVK